MYDIVFSLAVHEQKECFYDLLDNVNKFVPNSLIVVHSKLGFDISNNDIEDYDNVILNPRSFNTGYFDQSLTLVHYSNIKVLVDKKVSAKYFAILGSNELFVRRGVFDYISSRKFIAYDCDGDDYNIKIAKCDPYMEKLLHGKTFVKTPPEGAFYPFQELVNVIESKNVSAFIDSLIPYFDNPVKCLLRRFFNKVTLATKRFSPSLVKCLPSRISRFGYASEEVFFPTIMNISTAEKDNSYCFVKWNDSLKLDLKDVSSVAFGHKYYKYSVKRVDRKPNDRVRSWIKNEIS